jgi:hypothetical protein
VSDLQALYDAVVAHSGLTVEELRDVAAHGADAGWGGFTYTRDCVRFYEANEGAIWALLREAADDQGVHPLALVATFSRADMADSEAGLKNLLAWFALEEVARAVADGTIRTTTDEEEESGER